MACEVIYKDGKRIGFHDDEVATIDTLSYVPLSDKVLQILTGDPSFHAEDLNEDYDEPESEDWTSEASDSIDPFPIDEYSDKVDVIEQSNILKEKVDKINKAYQEVTQSVVEQGTDSSSVTEESK